ncbi:haloacid dehalogenase-like hydrolase [Clostridium senegalense]|uniref:haloacid dehalogenase-like hydrolase n=1 Tax=Clostridium senegalense TaxID=1465809 RepID=UPI001FD04EC8|nr:haloacid dehalogenase-like hydrolase [Clostridium senegalense]
MKNKRILALLMVTCLTVGTLVGCGKNQNTETQENKNVASDVKKDEVKLQKLNWSENNFNALNKLIEENGIKGKNYDENKKPYIVVDWDNTSIYNDVEEALLIYQLENLEFKMSPEELSKVLRKDIPKDNFNEKCNNKDGQPVNIDLIAEDIDSDYKFIYENYKGMKGDKTLEDMKKTSEYKDFIAKTRYLYDSIGKTFSADISYPWVTYLFAGMNENEVKELAEKGIDNALNEKIGVKSLTSPEELPGKAGVVSVSYNSGLRTLEEQQNLYNTLMENGIDVYVCSASFVDIVKTFASNPKYKYNVPEQNIMAMELQRKDNVIVPEFKEGYDQTQGAGKTKTIKRFLASEKGYGPILVAGDSAGDVAMLKDFEDTKIGLIINRLKDGEIGELSKLASESVGKEDAKYLLQGRDENTGTFRPSEKSIMFEQTEEGLLHK